MALRTVLVSDVPSLPESVYGLSEGIFISLFSDELSSDFCSVSFLFIILYYLITGLDLSKPKSFRFPGFSVIGHRGNGMNVLQSSDRRNRGVKENSILSFNSAAKFPIDFIEFDVQVGVSDLSIYLYSL